MNLKRLFTAFLITFLTLTSALAQNEKAKRGSLSMGVFLSNHSNDITLVGSNIGAGVNVNLEKALGLQVNNAVFRADFDYKLGKKKRSEVFMGYFGFNRKASKILEDEINIGDQTFPVGTEANSQFNFQLIKVGYGYDIVSDERLTIGTSLGFYIMPISFRLESQNFDEEATDFIAPLPILGLDLGVWITPKLYYSQEISFLYLSISDFTGLIFDTNLKIDYSITDYFALGLGLKNFRINIEGESITDGWFDFDGTIKSSFLGLQLYTRFRF
jgi:hypothetical protein